MDKNLIDLSDLENALSALGDVNYEDELMTDEMKASQARCDSYIEKHMDND
ncbi:MAG: hypothetical protein IJF37_00100 [Lachnospiraceae bacterium]|nr:hypothetical protein [Lachnospiraceae bacterium]